MDSILKTQSSVENNEEFINENNQTEEIVQDVEIVHDNANHQDEEIIPVDNHNDEKILKKRKHNHKQYSESFPKTFYSKQYKKSKQYNLTLDCKWNQHY
jgi:hypothetical protein